VHDGGGARAPTPRGRSPTLQLRVPRPSPTRAAAHQLHPVLLPHVVVVAHICLWWNFRRTWVEHIHVRQLPQYAPMPAVGAQHCKARGHQGWRLARPPSPPRAGHVGACPWAVRRNDQEERKHGKATELQWRVAISIYCLSHKHILVWTELIRYIYAQTHEVASLETGLRRPGSAGLSRPSPGSQTRPKTLTCGWMTTRVGTRKPRRTMKDRLGDQRGGSEWEPIKILLEGD
jgi:hypothetical protein